jgi:hypothetical protein
MMLKIFRLSCFECCKNWLNQLMGWSTLEQTSQNRKLSVPNLIIIITKEVINGLPCVGSIFYNQILTPLNFEGMYFFHCGLDLSDLNHHGYTFYWATFYVQTTTWKEADYVRQSSNTMCSSHLHVYLTSMFHYNQTFPLIMEFSFFGGKTSSRASWQALGTYKSSSVAEVQLGFHLQTSGFEPRTFS